MTLFWGGCYRVIASPASLNAVEKEISALEEELEDSAAKAKVRQKALTLQLREIESINAERILFFDALARKTRALMEDVVQVFDDLGRFDSHVKGVKRGAGGHITRLAVAHKEATREWEARVKAIRALFCGVDPKNQACTGAP
ncbi:hypothetical protein KKF84_05655 [Myxococcota bacterium]|nr:hypothetical protein [Myxococcota bacterium]MBU1534783.1 hypothetical protein [Myxococcota bacterium]